ncbi:MAG: lipid-A-disaccharide synthase, partial [Acidobacteriota bacterium]|nr:lipid-A-disaccharide synthase [Acidobacteriota bacterium]
MATDHLTIMIVAGERSGDVYGGRLARELRRRLPSVELFGCCGEVMTAEGVEAAAEARAFSMVGITEVAGGLPRAWRAFRRLVKAAA